MEQVIGYYFEVEGGQRYRVSIDVRLSHRGQGDYQTINHEAVTEYDEFAVTASVDEKRGSRWVEFMGGQCRGDVAKVTDFVTGWNRARVDKLVALWERWHLNGMRAACAHMQVIGDGRYDSNKHLVCPETEYRYGSAWLVEVIPEDVLDEMRTFLSTVQVI